MSKKKSTFQPSSRYAVVDLPIAESIQRATELYEDNPLGVAVRVHDERLDVTYHLATVGQSTLNASASIIRWEGTKTRIMIRSFNPGVSPETVDWFLMTSLFWFAIFPAVAIYNQPILPQVAIVFLMHMAILFVVLYQRQFNSQLVQGHQLDKRVDAVWSKLLNTMDDSEGHNNTIIEQGEQDITLYEDYLSTRQLSSLEQ